MNAEDVGLYAAVGHAVVSAQLFEKLFVITARFAVKQADLQVFEEIKTVEAAAAFKQPIKALLKEVSGDLQSGGLAERIERLIDDRNLLVHRLVDEGPWPGEITETQRAHLFSICTRVSEESSAVVEILNPLMREWMGRFPQIGIEWPVYKHDET